MRTYDGGNGRDNEAIKREAVSLEALKSQMISRTCKDFGGSSQVVMLRGSLPWRAARIGASFLERGPCLTKRQLPLMNREV
jgi:hypothetical protein